MSIEAIRGPKYRNTKHKRQNTANNVYIYLDPGLHGHECEHGLHVDERLADLAVHGAQEAQRDGQLEQQAVHHHQVAHRHLA